MITRGRGIDVNSPKDAHRVRDTIRRGLDKVVSLHLLLRIVGRRAVNEIENGGEGYYSQAPPAFGI